MSCAVDIAPIGYAHGLEGIDNPYEKVLEEYIHHHDYATFLQGASEDFLSLYPAVEVDVGLIDGDHTYEGVSIDFSLLSRKSKILVFHDVQSDACLPLMRFWENIKMNFPQHTIEFSDEYEELYPKSYLGIGVLMHPDVFDCR
jgi:hypothetical protein